MKKLAIAVILLMVGVFGIQILNAKTIWKWTDKKGSIHYSDNISSIPVKYRKNAVEVEIPDEDTNVIEDSKVPPPKEENLETLDDEGKGEDFWRSKAASARRALKNAETDYNLKKALFESSYSNWLQVPTQINRDRLEKSRKDLKKAEAAKKKAKNYLDVELPNEAKKAGALPGWLRETNEEKKNNEKNNSKKKEKKDN